MKNTKLNWMQIANMIALFFGAILLIVINEDPIKDEYPFFIHFLFFSWIFVSGLVKMGRIAGRRIKTLLFVDFGILVLFLILAINDFYLLGFKTNFNILRVPKILFFVPWVMLDLLNFFWPQNNIKE